MVAVPVLILPPQTMVQEEAEVPVVPVLMVHIHRKELLLLVVLER